MQPDTTTASKAMAANTRRILAEKHLTQRDLATALGWSEPTTSRRLNGGRPWPLEAAIAVSEYLGVDLDTLASREVAA